MPADNHNNIPYVFDQKELEEHVKFLSEITPARNYKNIQSLNAASDYIERHFIKYGYSPIHQTYEVEGQEYKNIIASYGNPNAPVFVIGAHYDVCGDQPGADDNASGVASLLSLAQKFSQMKPALPFRIEFVAFTLEEPPFFRTNKMGSYVHAKSLKDKGVNVIGMACLEMVGYFSTKDRSQRYPFFLMKLFYPSKGDFIAVVGNFKSSKLVDHFHNHIGQASIKTEKLTAPSLLPGVDFSDHKNYWKFGYQAIMITDTSFYRNHNYHEMSDTIETLDFSKMAEVTRGIYFAITNLKT
jgi:Zn-dependent M28 family amino/carboxypeptidase